MGVQAIDQNVFPEVLGKTKVLYCPMSTTEGNRTIWSFPILRGNCLIYCMHSHLITILLPNYYFLRQIKKLLFQYLNII